MIIIKMIKPYLKQKLVYDKYTSFKNQLIQLIKLCCGSLMIPLMLLNNSLTNIDKENENDKAQ